MLLAGTGPGLAEHFEHRWRPLSAGVAVPVFAFFATGVTLGGLSGLRSSFIDPVAVGVVIGLVVGKTVGIFGAAYGLARLTRAQLDEELSWFDVWGLALLGGIGFTVSLLIGELAFGADRERDDHVKGRRPHRQPARRHLGRRGAAGPQRGIPTHRGGGN